MTRPEVRCPGCGEDRLVEWDPVLRRWECKVCGKHWEAVARKLEAQAEFVFWWDTHATKDKGGRPQKTRRGSATGIHTAGKNGLPDRSVIDRWRRKLNDPDKFETTYLGVAQLRRRLQGLV